MEILNYHPEKTEVTEGNNDTFCLDTPDERGRSKDCLQAMPCKEEENEVKKYHKKIKALEKAPGALLRSA